MQHEGQSNKHVQFNEHTSQYMWKKAMCTQCGMSYMTVMVKESVYFNFIYYTSEVKNIHLKHTCTKIQDAQQINNYIKLVKQNIARNIHVGVVLKY